METFIQVEKRVIPYSKIRNIDLGEFTHTIFEMESYITEESFLKWCDKNKLVIERPVYEYTELFGLNRWVKFSVIVNWYNDVVCDYLKKNFKLGYAA